MDCVSAEVGDRETLTSVEYHLLHKLADSEELDDLLHVYLVAESLSSNPEHVNCALVTWVPVLVILAV